MNRTRLGRSAAAVLVAVLVLVGLVAMPAGAAVQPLGDPDTFGGRITLAPSGTAVGAGEATVTLERWLNGARTPIPGATATTDANGDYLITGLPAGVPVYATVTYTGSAPNRAVTTMLNSTTARIYNFRIVAAYRFSGHVDISPDGSAEGRPAGAGEVEVRLRWTGSSSTLATTVTDANGNYSFERTSFDVTHFLEFRYLGAGQYPNWYENGDGIGSREIDTARQVNFTQDVVADVVIGHGAGVAGTLVGSNGEPIAGAEVVIETYDAEAVGNPHIASYSTVTDASGQYAVRGLPNDRLFSAIWRAPGYSWGRNDGGDFYRFGGFIDVEPDTVTTGVDGTLYLESAIDVTIRLISGFGMPAFNDFGYQVAFARYDEGTDRWEESGGFLLDDVAGHKRIQWLTPGLYTVRVIYDGPKGYNSIESGVFELEEDSLGEFETHLYPPGNSNNIYRQYLAYGGSDGPLGAGLTGSAGGGTVAVKGGGVVAHFEHGSIYTSKLGTWVVWSGPIADEFAAKGGVPGTYGWPKSAETCVQGLCTQKFQGGTIAPKPLAVVKNPTLSGSFAVGAKLTAAAGTYSPAATRWSYVWLRDGEPIGGAASASYTLRPDDLGHRVQVRVTASRVGQLPTEAISAQSPVIGVGVLTPSPVPKITGTVRVGQTLSATPGAWAAGTSLGYQWFASGVPIEGAVDSTLVLEPEHVGKKITVAVTGSLAAYATTTRVSVPSAAVAARPFVTSVVPVVSGTAQVGEQLTADPGVWSPAASFRYQWYADGVAIKNATAAVFTPSGSQRGKVITVAAIGSALGHVTLSRTSAKTARVATGVWVATPDPTVVGDPRVGSPLQVSTAGWQASARFTYQWYANGAAISKATAASFTPTSAQLGKTVTVRITTTTSGYPVVKKVSLPSATVAPGVFISAPVPTLSGPVRSGTVVKAVPGTWSPAATLSYQWLDDGVPIPKVTSATYTPTAALIGSALSVQVTAKRAGFTTLVRVSEETVVAPAAFATTPVPRITGTARVGSKLTAVSGTWSKPAVLSYQWSADGAEIAGATGSTFVLTPDQVGLAVTVSVTGAAPNYATVTKASSATAAVIP